MADFFEVMAFVFGGLMIVSLIVSVAFSQQATLQKSKAENDKHKATKKKSNISALVAGGSIVLGVVCVVLNHKITLNERKESINSQLFNNEEKLEISSKSDISSSGTAEISSKPFVQSSSDQQTSKDLNNNTAPFTNAQKLDYMEDCSEMLTNGEYLTSSQISILRSTINAVLIQLITSINGSTSGILDGLSDTAESLDTDTLTSLSDGLSGFAAKTIKSYIDSHKVITDYLTKLENSETVTPEETTQCANKLGYLSAMARTDLD